jgi:hypothetical protein
MGQSAKLLLLFAPFFLLNQIYAQEQLGLRLGNYAGINGVTLNPTAGVNNPLGWDINIVSAGSFLTNDFAFIRDASVVSAARNGSTLGPAPETKLSSSIIPTKYFDFFNRPHDKYFSTTNFALLPSVQFNLESGHSFGVFVGQRAAVATREIPVVADPYEQLKIQLGQRTSIPPLRATGMTWGELGFNYAYQLGDNTEGGLSLGVNVKFLRGNQGFFVENFDGTAVTRMTKDSTRVDALNVKAGFTNNFTDKVFSNNGSGLGIDLGAQFTIGSGTSDDRPYLCRFNATLMDLGRVSFRNNTEVHALKLTEPLKIDTKDYQNLDPNDPEGDALRRFNKAVFGKADSTRVGNYFAVNLPSAVSLQGDFAILENVFVNGLLIQRLPMPGYTLSRDNILAITPRYESRWFAASLPLNILNYEQVRLGLAARLAFLTFGTDHLLSFLGQKRLSGTDFYLALKINAFTIGKMGSIGGFGSGVGGGRNTKCYRF